MEQEILKKLYEDLEETKKEKSKMTKKEDYSRKSD